MGKAILIMDDPKCCESCMLREHFFIHVCKANEKEIPEYLLREKPTWCPVRPMPKRIYYGKDCSEWDDGYQCGVAAALRAIEGSEEND